MLSSTKTATWGTASSGGRARLSDPRPQEAPPSPSLEAEGFAYSWQLSDSRQVKLANRCQCPGPALAVKCSWFLRPIMYSSGYYTCSLWLETRRWSLVLVFMLLSGSTQAFSTLQNSVKNHWLRLKFCFEMSGPVISCHITLFAAVWCCHSYHIFVLFFQVF